MEEGKRADCEVDPRPSAPHCLLHTFALSHTFSTSLTMATCLACAGCKHAALTLRMSSSCYHRRVWPTSSKTISTPPATCFRICAPRSSAGRTITLRRGRACRWVADRSQPDTRGASQMLGHSVLKIPTEVGARSDIGACEARLVPARMLTRGVMGPDHHPQHRRPSGSM